MPGKSIKEFGITSLDEAFTIAFNGYASELDLLVRLVHSGNVIKLLPAMLDYSQFLARGKRKIFGTHPLELVCDSNGVIGGLNTRPRAEELFTCANLVACCYLFSSWTIPLGSLERSQVGQYCERAISHISGDTTAKTNLMGQRLNSGDAGRVIHTLKILGLIEADSTRYKQLSIGASNGMRDREAIHQMPIFRPLAEDDRRFTAKTRWKKLPPMQFGIHKATVEDIVLVDNNPKHKKHYEWLNTTEKGRVLALNQDAGEALENLFARIEAGHVRPRDLVVLFRMEPVVMPDVDGFLDAVGDVIDEKADLVITIGAGESTEEFELRLRKMDEIAGSLLKRGMKPVRIKWYHGNTIEEQRNKPLFGSVGYASYEILYCKLHH